MRYLVRSGVAVQLRLARVVTKLAYRGPRLLVVVGHVLLIRSGYVMLYVVPLRWRSSCSSSPSVMVLSAKGSSSYFSRYSSISSMDSGVRSGS